MPLSINGHKITTLKSMTDQLEGKLPGYRDLPKPEMTNITTDGFKSDQSVACMEHEFIYVDLKDSTSIHYMQALRVTSGVGLYFYNDSGERLFLAISGKFDCQWGDVFNYFKDKSCINMMIIGGGTYVPTQQSNDVSSILLLKIWRTIFEQSVGADWHINLVARQVLLFNKTNETQLPEVFTHYLYNKLNAYSRHYFQRDLSYSVSFNNTASNFQTEMPEKFKDWFQVVEAFILTTFYKFDLKKIFKHFPCDEA